MKKLFAFHPVVPPLIVALAAALAGCQTQPSGGSGGGPQLVFSGLNAAILSISGTSARDIYAVGADADDGLGPYVIHYDGGQWERLTSGLTGHLWWISVTPIDGAFYLAGTVGKVVRFTPADGGFERFTTPGEETMFGVWGSSANALWAVGGDEDDGDVGGVLWRYDGTAWSVVDLSAVLPDGVPLIYKVWGRAADDVYAVGRLGLILHFDGSAWSQLASDTTRTLFTVHGNATQTIAVGGFIDGVIVEQTGDAFTNVAPVGAPQVNGIFVPPDGPACAVGIEAAVALRDADGWTFQDFGLGTMRDFHTVWIDPDGGIWTVGGDLSLNLTDGIVAYIGDATISTRVSP